MRATTHLTSREARRRIKFLSDVRPRIPPAAIDYCEFRLACSGHGNAKTVDHVGSFQGRLDTGMIAKGVIFYPSRIRLLPLKRSPTRLSAVDFVLG
jgi:hypothetical protein